MTGAPAGLPAVVACADTSLWHLPWRPVDTLWSDLLCDPATSWPQASPARHDLAGGDDEYWPQPRPPRLV